MPLGKITLNKCLCLLSASPRSERTLLRDMVKNERKREEARQQKARGEKVKSSGGDFYNLFWYDAEKYVEDDTFDFDEAISNRIARDARKANRYPALKTGFLAWWRDKRRSFNQPYQIVRPTPHGSYLIPGGTTISIDDPLAVRIDGRTPRIVYPYFGLRDPLQTIDAILGLCVMANAIADTPPSAMRILDVYRAVSFSLDGVTVTGTELGVLQERCAQLTSAYEQLKKGSAP